MYSTEWVKAVRKDFPALANLQNGKHPIYFDNACTTLVPDQVIKSINEYYTGFPGCGAARSRHWFAKEVYSRIEGNPDKGIIGSRSIIKEFINAGSGKEIIFTMNASHGINIIALGMKFKPGDTVVLTDKEHNSNLLPWIRLKNKGIINLEIIESDENDNFDIESYKKKLKHNRVRLVSMAYTSNLTGYTIPADEIIRLAHEHNALVLLDAAQAAPHCTIDVQNSDVDFLVFSVHKMCGPRGVGILYGKQKFLGMASHEEDEADYVIEPCFLGGGTVADSTYNTYSLLDPPQRFEVGIQNYPAQIAAGAAVKYLQEIGLSKINEYIISLNKFMTEQILSEYGKTGWFKIIGPEDASKRGGILTFEIKRPNALGISEDLSDRSNIMIRD
ncbi:MAG: aminotransferase class V-fold PLP-dependent enzyme, partial [Spirochaetes bacterium]|nr:aminotransferase class V-fold PLP-dependent enzyme [Spirochaetota bacterium]